MYWKEERILRIEDSIFLSPKLAKMKQNFDFCDISKRRTIMARL